MTESQGTIWMHKALVAEVVAAVQTVPSVIRTAIDDGNLPDTYPMTTIVYYYNAEVTDRMELANRLDGLLRALDTRSRAAELLDIRPAPAAPEDPTDAE